MSWQGANIALLHASGGGGDDDPKNESVDPVSSTRYPRRDNLAEFGLPATETVEAALNRLTKSYTLAMTCVGAWHRTDSAIATAAKAAVNFETHAASSSFETTGTALEESTATLWRVGRAARQAFEIQIFKDPLISPLVPAWSTRYNLSLASFAADVASPPLLNSSCHQATVQQLAYLSLVNYADLILSGLQTMKSCNNDGILDRGLVQTLQSFQYPCFISTPGGWNSVSDGGETEHEGSNDHNATMDISTQSKESECVEETLRLAIAAYLDATAMDGSDPTVWVKLASVVRHLNRCTILHVNSVTPSKRSDDETHSSSRIQFPHRRLERYALERALTALPLHEPRNRMAERAFAEWQIEHEDKETNTYSSQINPQQSSDPIVLFLNLPRYSWTTLGRMLLRACREGSHFADGDTKRPEQQNGSLAITRVQHSRCEQSSFLINPLLCVHLSPILALPSTILTRVVSFIDRDHNWRLEATCRAMSASVISVRAAMDNASERTDRRQRRLSHCGAAKPADTRNSQPTLETATTKSSRSEATSTLLHQEELTKHNEDEDVEDRVKRVSKRVRSQILSSGKRAERKNRRSSTEYCLLGATLGCSVNDASYRNLLQQENDERGVGESFLRVGDSISPTNHRLADIDKEDSVEAWNESSLVSFVNGCRDQPCYPLSFLFRFVAHVSINVAQVFSSDSHSSLTMTTCLLDCKYGKIMSCHKMTFSDANFTV